MPGRTLHTTIGAMPLQAPDLSLAAFYTRPVVDYDANAYAPLGAWDPWPVCSGEVNDGSGGETWPLMDIVTWSEEIQWAGGGNRPFRIVGVTRDGAGNIVPGANVDLYRTVDDVLVASTVSDAGGSFAFAVDDNTTPYYIRAWRLSPAIQGTTVDTLVGTP